MSTAPGEPASTVGTLLGVWEIQTVLMLALSLVLFCVKVFALVDCVIRDPASFEHADTIAKQGWVIILVLAVAAHAVRWSPFGLLNLIGTVAALVYLVQLRGNRDGY
jgi:hypothetical protein